jgi:hypothetical protein
MSSSLHTHTLMATITSKCRTCHLLLHYHSLCLLLH